MRVRRLHAIPFTMLLLPLWSSPACQSVEIPRYKRFEARFENPSWRGNPFDLVLRGTFTSPSGRRLDHFGFYAGSDTWKIYFMPDEVGPWTWRTRCPDPDLDGKSGTFICVDSRLDAPLTAAGNRWTLASTRGEFPVIWNPPVPDGAHWGFRGRDPADPMVRQALRFADEVVGARLLGFGELLIAPVDWARHWPQSAVPYVAGKEGDEFYLPFWDQLNATLDAARDRNMGAYVMLYSDDALTPDHFGLTPRSTKELRLFRYVVARLACYPHVLWDSGIDIGEYRDTRWIDWYADWFTRHDPWDHPVGSRTGGGSGGVLPEAATYHSIGGPSLPSRPELLALHRMNVPVAHTDHWRPFHTRGNWTHRKIRVAVWRCALTGAQVPYPDYNQGKVDYGQVPTGGRTIGFATRFFRTRLRCDLRDLRPHDELIVAGENVILAADPGTEFVAYDEDGGDVTIDLSATKNPLRFTWYNPRTGQPTQSKRIEPGKVHTFNSPTTGHDWVLHVFTE